MKIKQFKNYKGIKAFLTILKSCEESKHIVLVDKNWEDWLFDLGIDS